MLLETLKNHAKSKNQNKLFIAYNENYYSFKQIDDFVNQTCNYFRNLNLKKGDRVCTSIDNSLTYILLYFASMRYGLVVNPSPTYLSELELIKNIKQINPKAVFIDKRLNLKKIATIKVVDDIVFLKKILKFSKKFNNKFKIRPNDIAVLYYSSGSTGKPKLIKISHKAIFESQKMQKNSTLKESGDRHLCILPLAHTSSLRSTLKFCLYNARSVFLYKNFWSIKDKFLEIIYKNKITFVQVVPSIINMLIKLYSKNRNAHKKLKSLKFIASGSAYLPEKLTNQFKKDFKVSLINIYGLSETCAISMTKLNRKYDNNGSVVGEVLRGIIFKIIDKKNMKVKINQPGELVIKSPSIFSGYYNDKSNNKYFTKDNYFKTGDIVISNNNKNLIYIERKKNIVIKSGININCREIDEFLINLNYITDSYTTSKSDLFHGEVPVSYIVLKFKKTKDEILRDLKKNLGDFKSPNEVKILKKIPRSQTGKIQYFLLNSHD